MSTLLLKYHIMIKQLQKFGKDISPHYKWWWQEGEIIIPFKTHYSAKDAFEELSNEYEGLNFNLKEVPNGWDVIVSIKEKINEYCDGGRDCEKYGAIAIGSVFVCARCKKKFN